MLLLIKFTIRARLRFLSHAETLKLFERACRRADIKMDYSEGFNPRAKLSLPLPRSVGLETDDDLLCLGVKTTRAAALRSDSLPPFDAERFMAGLSNHLPEGCRLLSVRVAHARTPFHPNMAAYRLRVRPEFLNDRLREKARHLMASENLNLRRRIDEKGNTRNLDVRGFLNSIEIDDKGVITVECRITPAGSIRVDEIIELLHLDTDKLAGPVRRINVQWQEKTKDR
ncbi:MAG TPA: TIGR03936 family radical SAM-associated protein [Sedimentisphaerales bacterium]|nr:TIGR03936 family radical SAM-associated protein [Sedimentisphaerales bacterium]